jgi:hypothetical protein
MAFHLKAALALGLMAAAGSVSAQPVGDAAPVTIEPDTDEYLQHAASVARVTPLRHQGEVSATIFSTVGGDPAMNGEYIFLAFDIEPHEPSRIFRIGDVLSYRILSETRGRVLLQVSENVMNDGGEIGTRNRRVLVTWTPGPDGAPSTVTVATAR